MALVFANGCFDCLHAGHLQFLAFCSMIAQGDGLIVAIDSDRRVAELKGPHRPYFSESERRESLFYLTQDGMIDANGFGKFMIEWVEIFDSDEELHRLIKRYDPDLIVKGADWKGKTVIGADVAPVFFAPTFGKELFSTTTIAQRILERHEAL